MIQYGVVGVGRRREPGVDRPQVAGPERDGRRDVEARRRQRAHQARRSQVGAEAEQGDLVELVADDGQSRPDDLEAVAEGHARAAEVDLARLAGPRVDPEQLAGVGLDEDQPAARGDDAVGVEPGDVLQVAGQRQGERRRRVGQRAMPAERDHDQLLDVRVGHVDRPAGDDDVVEEAGRELVGLEQGARAGVVGADLAGAAAGRPDAVPAAFEVDAHGDAPGLAGGQGPDVAGAQVHLGDRAVGQRADVGGRAAAGRDPFGRPAVGEVDLGREVVVRRHRRDEQEQREQRGDGGDETSSHRVPPGTGRATAPVGVGGQGSSTPPRSPVARPTRTVSGVRKIHLNGRRLPRTPAPDRRMPRSAEADRGGDAGWCRVVDRSAYEATIVPVMSGCTSHRKK